MSDQKQSLIQREESKNVGESAGASKVLFHFAECTNCKHILPLSTTTEKYFAILSKDPTKTMGLGEKCMRCGADSWVLVVG